MTLVRKSLILAHRCLGIALCLLAVMWFATGIVMMYAGGMPRLSPEMRLERLPALDLSRVRVSAADAAARVGFDPSAIEARVRLLTVLDRPAYRFDQTIVFADTGDILEEASVDQGRAVVSRFSGEPIDRIRYERRVEVPDQWNLTQGRELPLLKFSVDDGQGTEAYVGAYTGEVTNFTTRRSRMLAWIGVIPHWFYFEALRNNQPLWYRLVVWTSGAVCVLAVLGLLLGIVQFRRTRPLRLRTAIPYAGVMRWHYVTGVIFGVFTLTWAFSGLLSMEPFAWTNVSGLPVRSDVFTGGALDLRQFASVDASTWASTLDGRPVKELELARIQGGHYYIVRQGSGLDEVAQRRERLHQPYYVTGRTEPERVLVDAATLQVRREPFSTDAYLAALRAEHPDVPIVESALLADYDSYYYSRGRQMPLPVLRVKLGDPGDTWLYVDPALGRVLSSVHRLNRAERWLYNGLHSLDFAFWYNRRPLWDIGMLTLLAGGLATSLLGAVMGVRRLRRKTLALSGSRVHGFAGSQVPEFMLRGDRQPENPARRAT